MTQEKFQAELIKLAKGYQPAPEVVNHISSVVLLMTVGPSGAGKSSVMRGLGLTYVVADTTREPRPEETEGLDYHFQSNYEQVLQDIKSGRFLQIAIGPSGDFYATRDEAYPKSGAATMAVVSDVVPIFRKLPFKKTITAFISPPNYQEWIRRMSIHPATEQQRTKRLAEARRSFQFALNDGETHFILNDSVDEAVRQLNDLVEGRTDNGREHRARQAIQEILNRID